MENQSIKDRAAKWLADGKKGRSSKTIYAFFMAKDYGETPPPETGYPSDSDDLGRCVALLALVPEWKDRLGELSDIAGLDGQAWAALAPIWNELESLYAESKHEAIYARMKGVLVPLEKASGEVIHMGKGVSMRMPKSAVESVALANYLVITRKAGIPDELAHETYKANKTSADALAALQIKNTIEAGEAMKAAVAGPGHNSGDPQEVGGVSGARLKAFLDRVERLEEEKGGIAEDIKDIYAEAKGVGFDTKIMRKVIKLRKMDSEKRREEEELLTLYQSAIGMD